MTRKDLILKRLLRRDSVGALLDGVAGQGDLAVSGEDGALLFGRDPGDEGEAWPVVADGQTLGQVRGAGAAQVAAILGLLAEQAQESRALAADSLEKYKELTMLYQLSAKLFSLSDVGQVVALIRSEAMRLVECDTVSVLLLNEQTGLLEAASADDEQLYGRSSLEVTDDLIGAVLRSGHGEIVNDLAVDARSISMVRPFASVICCPLKVRNRVFGVVVLGKFARHEYHAGELQLVGSLAAQASIALEVTRLNRELTASAHKPAEVIYGVEDVPPPGVTGVLALQHVMIALMSLAYPVLVTLEAGGDLVDASSVLSMTLIAMGMATLLQVRVRPPFGAGYLVNQIPAAIYLAPSLIAARVGGLGLVFGMTVFAGLVGIVLSRVIGRFRKIFPPEVSGVVVLMVGLSMIEVAMMRFVGIAGDDRVTTGPELLVGFVTIGVIIALTVSRSPRLRLGSTLVGFVVGFTLGAALGLVDPGEFERLRALPFFGAPQLPEARLEFDALLVPVFAAAALASGLVNAGLVTGCQKANDRNWKRPEGRSISGGILADGVGNVGSGLLGGVGVVISPGNVGLSIATGALSRVIGVAVGLVFLALAFMPQALAAFALMPSPVIGAGLMYVACYLITSGVQLIVSRMLDSRRTFIIGLAIVGGLGVRFVPQAFADAPEWVQAFLGSPLALSTTLAVGLNLLLSLGVSNTARISVPLSEPLRDTLNRFVERHGAGWGARNDVIGRAAPALIDWCEELRHSGWEGTAEIEMRFDEFRLSILVRPVAHDDQAPPVRVDAEQLATIHRHLRRRYDCSVTALSPDQMDVVRIDFEH